MARDGRTGERAVSEWKDSEQSGEEKGGAQMNGATSNPREKGVNRAQRHGLRAHTRQSDERTLKRAGGSHFAQAPSETDGARHSRGRTADGCASKATPRNARGSERRRTDGRSPAPPPAKTTRGEVGAMGEERGARRRREEGDAWDVGVVRAASAQERCGAEPHTHAQRQPPRAHSGGRTLWLRERNRATGR